MMMTTPPSFDIRAGSPADHRVLAETVAKALLFPPRDDEGWESVAASWVETSCFGAWDGDTCAGSVSQFFVDTTVPGGAQLPTGAVSRVGVLPTHRRRGLATLLMHRLIDDSVERGLALMSLRASEALIYERYGFGMAGEFTSVTITSSRARPVRGAAIGGTFRFVARDEILATVEPIYARSLHRRPGIVTRPPSWWQRYFLDALKQGTSSYVVVHEDEHGVADGYAHYDVAWNESPAHGGTGEIHEVVAVDDATELAVWGFLFDTDLVRTWQCDERAVDDILREAVYDRRAYAVKDVDDEQWIRLIDVDRALRARTYNAASGAVTIAVTDPRVPANDGTWRVDADGAARTDEAAQLRGRIDALSAAYLGGTSWHALAATGRVHATDPAAVALADTLFASRPLPCCGSFF
jgi:predicted acetyltransferase